MSNLKYFEIDSSKIFLSKINHQSNSLQGKVKLKNITDKYLIFKIMINKPKVYTASPSCSFIAPNSSIEILIKRIESHSLNLKGDFFLFKAYPTLSSIKDVSKLIINKRQKKQNQNFQKMI